MFKFIELFFMSVLVFCSLTFLATFTSLTRPHVGHDLEVGQIGIVVKKEEKNDFKGEWSPGPFYDVTYAYISKPECKVEYDPIAGVSSIDLRALKKRHSKDRPCLYWESISVNEFKALSLGDWVTRDSTAYYPYKILGIRSWQEFKVQYGFLAVFGIVMSFIIAAYLRTLDVLEGNRYFIALKNRLFIKPWDPGGRYCLIYEVGVWGATEQKVYLSASMFEEG